MMAAVVASSMTALAGGLLTNTNQNAAYVRQMSQNGIIDITGLYANPAGTAFLADGWHLSLNSQTAWQQRNITTTFPLFALNTNTPGNATHEFKGKAFAPVIPSFQLSYNKGKWSVNANFALVGGGGKCEFDQGLGSFEALYAGEMFRQVPGMVNSLIEPMMPMVKAGVKQTVAGKLAAGMIAKGMDPAAAAAQANALANMGTYDATPASQLSGYNMNAYMKGRSYYFGLQLGGTYKFTKNLSAYIGIRGIYATCNYNGYVQDINAAYTAAADYTYSIDPIPGVFEGVEGNDRQVLEQGAKSLNDNELTLNADQTGFGVSPIIGIDWKINKHWNVAAKYEAPTKMVLKNKSEMNKFAQAKIAEGNATLGKFADGTKVREDIPGILALGAQYSPCQSVRINAGFNEYFDKSARKGMEGATVKGAGIDKNTWEINAGIEYDVCKYITLSVSYQKTNYGISDEGMTDLSFNLSNQMVGAGLRINATKRCSIDLGYMHTFYGDRTVITPTAAGPKTDNYVRKNDVFGVGVNLAF